MFENCDYATGDIKEKATETSKKITCFEPSNCTDEITTPSLSIEFETK